MGTQKFTKLLLTIASLIVVAFYFSFIRNSLPGASSSLIEGIVLIILIALFEVALLVTISTTFFRVLKKDRMMWFKGMGEKMTFMAIMVLLILSIVLGSQWTAYTPKIIGEDNKPKPNSIATIEKFNLGGVKQWVIIRGEDVSKPVLLFLSGGPGASEAARVIRFNKELEKHFIVVIWEQRGCGKSYPSINPKDKLTVDQYVSDLVELSEMLRNRFNEEKIYLVGHSWGTIIGVRAAQARPDLYHAYISSAQMVNIRETDQMIFDLVMDKSRKIGDEKFVSTLEKQGIPPYFGKNPIGPYSTLFGREYALFEVPNIQNPEYLKDGDILLLMLKQPEYGWLDRLYYLLGLMNTFNAVYPQLQEIDFRLDATHLELPVYMFLGRHDMNNPITSPQDYFNKIDAPYKELFIFENSGHGMIWEEAGLFHQKLITKVIPETYK